MPNLFAQIMLFGWPLVVFALFRRLPPAAALCWSILAGYLLLPTRTGLNLPMVPTIDKDGMPVLTAAVMLVLGVGAAGARGLAGPGRAGWGRAGADEARPRHGRALIAGLLVLLFVSPVLTVLTNADPVPAGPWRIPGLRPYDAASTLAGMGITLLPFLLARRFLASPESHVLLLRILVVAMLCYSMLILYEVRMSPQLNRMIYGFFPHSFQQHMRAGGFRPLVFLNHGLWLAILVSMTILAAVALWRHRLAEGGGSAGPWLLAAFYLSVVLFLSNSLGALALTLLLAPAVALLGVRGQLLVAAILAGVVLLYPMLRGSGLVPVDRIHAISLAISEDRAQSFMFRIENEDRLLDRAAEKPLFGWGKWGRNLVFDQNTGQSISVTDGAWIIIIGNFGWLGYIAQFGLLTVPILLLALRRGTLGLSPATGGLALVMAVNLIDLLPNATLTPVTWLIGGALAGRLAHAARPSAEAEAAGPAPLRRWRLVTDDPPLQTPGHPAGQSAGQTAGQAGVQWAGQAGGAARRQAGGVAAGHPRGPKTARSGARFP
jgi:hypothetical protein